MIRTSAVRRSFGWSLAGLLLLAVPATAQVAYPPKPEKYEAHFRYRIRADRDERIRQFRAMERFLAGLGFVPTPREDADLDIFDPTAERMSGTIPSANAARLLEDPRILTAVLIPAGTTLPEDPRQPVPIRIGLATGLGEREQRLLHHQLSRHLEWLGFRESVGYDHAGHTLLRGSIPAENLFTLLKDVRTQPSGWFAPTVSPELLPLPLRGSLPIRLVEVLSPLPAAAPAEAAPPAGMGMTPVSPKLTPELAAALADPATADKPIRVELILQNDPADTWRDLRFRLRTTVEGISIEGQVGVVVSVRLDRAQGIARLAELAEVRSIRLPRPGSETARPLLPREMAPPTSEVLSATRLANLHRFGFRGRDVRVVVIASEFPGATGMIGNQLPATTRLIDLTAELSPDLMPSAPNPDRPGVGPAVALAVQAAAPDARLVLVRVDPTAFHQLLTVARSVGGEPSFSEAMQSRSAELIAQADRLTLRRAAVSEEYRQAYATLSDEPAAVKRREEARAAFDKLREDERQYNATVARFAALRAALDGLRGSDVVVNTLVWNTGYPQDGLSELSRYLDEAFAPRPVRSALKAAQQPPVPLWVQAASTAVGQVWAGAFHDADGNGVMEFAPTTTPVPPQHWTRELNFLGFVPPTGEEAVRVLPAGAKLRITVQWREPHDPEGYGTRDSHFPLTLRLLRQIDPTGKTAASDELVEVARSTGAPVRLLLTRASAAFEQTLEVTIPADGAFALRVEGHPAFDYPLPALRQNGELSPRIMIEAADPATARRGRPVFVTYTTLTAGVGVPGDSAAALTIGIAGKDGKPVGTLLGAGPGVQLLTKPDLLTEGTIALDGIGASGSAVAAGYAGGAAASLRSAGVRARNLTTHFGVQPGAPLVLPAEWLTTFTVRRGPATER